MELAVKMAQSCTFRSSSTSTSLLFTKSDKNNYNSILRRRSANCLYQAYGRFAASISASGQKEHSTPVFSTDEVIFKLQTNVMNSAYHKPYQAMYSSIIGGITIDPALMLIPLDDHMVHRGHGVFDTALICNGYLYELEEHLDRLLRSASMAKIKPPFDRQTLKNILVDTVAASHCNNGLLRYWLSAGPGDFGLSSKNCIGSSFYAIVTKYEEKPIQPVKAVTSSIPMKPPLFATMKNVNYLPNALSIMEAEAQGAASAIWIDEEGYVAEGPNMNVAFVSKEGVLIMPPFDKTLSGCTAKRTLAIARELVNSSNKQVSPLKAVKVEPVSVEQGKNAAEMMLIGSSSPVVPVIQWDDRKIGNGEPGPVTLTLQTLLKEDKLNGPTVRHQRITYN